MAHKDDPFPHGANCNCETCVEGIICGRCGHPDCDFDCPDEICKTCNNTGRVAPKNENEAVFLTTMTTGIGDPCPDCSEPVV